MTKKDISRQELKDTIRFVGELRERYDENNSHYARDRIIVANPSSTYVEPGKLVQIQGRFNTMETYERAFVEYLQYGIIAKIKYPGDSATVGQFNACALTLTGISPGYREVGYARMTGTLAGPVDFEREEGSSGSGDIGEYKYARPDSNCIFKAVKNGPYFIFGKSLPIEGTEVRFCFLQLVGGVGGDGVDAGGHRVGVTRGVVVAGEEQYVTVFKEVSGQILTERYSCTCPLLSGSATIPDGATVVISRNIDTNKWQIIESACE